MSSKEVKEEVKIRYDESGLDERIIRAVTEMGFEYMSPIQAAAIPVMMEGVDIIGQAQTGTGKTAAFGIPLLSKVDPENKNKPSYFEIESCVIVGKKLYFCTNSNKDNKINYDGI